MPMNNDGHNYHVLMSDEPTNTFLSGHSPLLSRSFSFGDEEPLFSVVSDLNVQAENDWHNLSTSVNNG